MDETDGGDVIVSYPATKAEKRFIEQGLFVENLENRTQALLVGRLRCGADRTHGLDQSDREVLTELHLNAHTRAQKLR